MFADGSHVIPEHASTLFNVALSVEYVGGNRNAARYNG